MTAQIIDGKAIAARIKQDLAIIIQNKVAQGNRKPGLAVILVGDDPASTIYVRHKRQACEDIGIHSVYHHLESDVTEEKLLDLIKTINHDKDIDGILLQLPLPKHIDADKVVGSAR